LRRTAALLVLLLAAAAPGTGCFRGRPQEADLILTGGVVHTLAGEEEGSGAPATAIAVRHGRLLAVGDDRSVLRHRGAATPVVDLKGATVVPGLIDAHVHLLGVGETLANDRTGGSLYVDLSETESEEDAVQRVRTRARDLKPGEWVLGKGWNQERWVVKELPDRRLLSDIVAYNPVFLVRSDAHAVWVNKKALDLAGITARTPDPPAGKIVRMPRSSEPSGILLDRAAEPVLRLIPALSAEAQAALIQEALRDFAARGYTTVTSAGSLNRLGLLDLGAKGDTEAEIFRGMAASGLLPIRVTLMIPGPSEAAEALLLRGPETGLGDGRLDIRAVKLFADGALGSRGAALLRPYADDPETSGLLRMTDEEIASWAARGLRRGVQIAVHAIGDAAVRAAVRGFAQALSRSPGAAPRFRIEHLSLFDPADLAALAETHAIAVVQPRFLDPVAGGPMEEARVGPERAARIYAFATLMEAGVPLAGSSDSYDRPGNPLLGFYTAVTRQTPAGQPPDGWHPEQRLTRLQALRMFTLGAAYAAFRDKDLGSLEPGKRADFTLLSQDILQVPADQILKTEVLATYVDGSAVYRRERPAAQ
jgi:predicted amidohydrolase YtcJ